MVYGSKVSKTLPKIGTKRWTAARKAAVVLAIEAKTVTFAQALSWYDLSVEELKNWIRAYAQHGLKGLTITKLHGIFPERKRKI